MFKSILLLFLMFLFVACNNTANSTFAEKDAMEYFIEYSPERGALFYSENRSKYVFLDDLYKDSIYPVLIDCNYYELKNIYSVLKETPIAEDIHNLVISSRDDLLYSISDEIDKNITIEQETFLTEILPIMEIGIDSIIHSGIEEIIDEYAGGIFNYKKLYFFTGRDINEFKDIWIKHTNKENYKAYVEQISLMYLGAICDVKTQYLKDITGRNVIHKISFKLPSIEFEISNEMINYVEKFTLNEKSEMTNEALKDWIAPIAIGLLTGGTGAAIYEFGSIGYDVKVTIDDIKNQKLDPNEIFMYICENDIYTQIKDDFIDSYTNNILNEIKSINHRTYHLIDIAL